MKQWFHCPLSDIGDSLSCQGTSPMLRVLLCQRATDPTHRWTENESSPIRIYRRAGLLMASRPRTIPGYRECFLSWTLVAVNPVEGTTPRITDQIEEFSESPIVELKLGKQIQWSVIIRALVNFLLNFVRLLTCHHWSGSWRSLEGCNWILAYFIQFIGSLLTDAPSRHVTSRHEHAITGKKISINTWKLHGRL
jgi:hypothetical protein